MRLNYLTCEQHDFFHENGFLVIKGFKSRVDCQRLKDRMAELVRDFDASSHSVVFSTNTEQDEAREAYFLDSSDKIRFFFEEEAFDQNGSLRYPKEESLNKAGHALHDEDPIFDAFSRSAPLPELAADLGVSNPILIEGMYIFKPPRIGGMVRPHQDASYLYTDPESTVGFWFALDQAGEENGCLWVLPGGHKGPLQCRYVRQEKGIPSLIQYDLPEWDMSAFMPVEAEVGDLVILHGLLPHMSAINRSQKARHAYTLHILSGDFDYPQGNWLQRPADHPARGF